MAILTEIYIKQDTLETLLNTIKAKNQKGVGITVSINDDTKEFTLDDGRILQQNTSAFVSQSKEDRDAEKQKFYVGNGRKVWDNGTIPKSLKVFKESGQQAAQYDSTYGMAEAAQEIDDDLPF